MSICLRKILPVLGCLALISGLAGSPVNSYAQPFQLHIQPVFSNEKIALGKTLHFDNHDSLRISTLKCYLGNFTFWENGQVVLSEKIYHLLDLEDNNPLSLSFDLPNNTAFDSIGFQIGVDSLTTASGVMGGDLDPTKGMFWTWQSGYINLKVEGFSSQCPARGGLFAFHLGGYLPPFRNDRKVSNVGRVNVGRVSNPSDVVINFDFSPFFHAVNWSKKSGIMSPCIEAVQLMEVLSTSFSWHEK